ncbi:viral A-type inclusion protein [Histomonas meleagridis]|uniref:viral A-type inclusion protein n=1 Tax=Histomonas meleagridis TaxID=135588 RepID=UPI003559C5DF|nr:viral A-type inclusion protein [Histomonas meleagridis]KAH0802763.1 viral A-type inclusion protein [Histomonas meleagridis]
MDIETLQAQLQSAQSEISQKEQKIAKLKGLLTRSMRSDKRREQEIETLHIDLADREKNVNSLTEELESNRAFSQKQTERIAKLEEELADLTNRLHSGIGSEATQRHNERMKKMLEKSNMLYAELQEKYQKLSIKYEEEKAKNCRVSNPQKAIILSNAEVFILNDDGTYTISKKNDKYPPSVTVYDFRNDRKAKEQKKEQNDQNILKAYLKRILLEFFICDTSTQTNLISVILQLLECSPEQISAAQRSFAEGRQIISKAPTMFGSK